MNYDYPDGDYADAASRSSTTTSTYQQGLMWFLANDPRVPEKVRERGRAAGAWQGRVHRHRRLAAPALRPRGAADDLRLRDDPAQLPGHGRSPTTRSAWPPTPWTRTTASAIVDAGRPRPRTRGTCRSAASRPTRSPTASIVPKEAECANLLVPVCLSASHIAYGSIRMEPVFMVLGQSAATAACHGDRRERRRPAGRLRQAPERLLADGQVLDPAPVKKATPATKAPANPKKPGVKRVICFGDSITAGAYPGLLGGLLGDKVEVINAGVGGHSTTNGLSRIAGRRDRQAAGRGGRAVRDERHADRRRRGAYVPLKEYEANLATMIDACQKAGAKVVLMTIPPINEEAYFTRHKRPPFEKVGGLTKLLDDYRRGEARGGGEEGRGDRPVGVPRGQAGVAEQGRRASEREGREIIAAKVAEAVKPLVIAK